MTSEPHLPGSSSVRAQVHRLCLYPVKSCGALSPASSWPAGEAGLALDRRWAVMDPARGRCLNQKGLRALCMVRPTLDVERGTMTLNYPKVKKLDQDMIFVVA